MGKGWDRGPKGGGWGQEEWTPPRPSSAPSARPAPARAVSTGPDVEARVKWFNGEKGFGFVEMTDGSGEAFLHIRAVEAAGHTALEPGTTLQVKIGQGQKGPQVTEVVSVDASTATPQAPRGPRPGGFGDRPGAGPRPGGGGRFQRDSGPTEPKSGVVKWYSRERGFGFVTPDDGGPEIFVHATALERAGMREIDVGQRLQLDVRQGQKGPEAAAVRSDD